MKQTKIQSGVNSQVEWCKEHPDSMVVGCKTCHQASLDFAELKLMELHEEIKAILGHAKFDMNHGAYSHWGWTGGDFKVKWDEKDDD